MGVLRLYQRTLSPLLGPACRFYPSCSEYAVEVIRRDGVWTGLRRTILRVARCTPLQPGGLDLP